MLPRYFSLVCRHLVCKQVLKCCHTTSLYPDRDFMSGPGGKFSRVSQSTERWSSLFQDLWTFLLCRVTELRFCFLPVPDFFEDSLPLPAQAYLKVCSAVSEASLNDVKPSSPPTIMDSPAKEAVSPSTGTTVQRTSVLHTQEIVRVQCYNIKTCLSFKCIVKYIIVGDSSSLGDQIDRTDYTYI